MSESFAHRPTTAPRFRPARLDDTKHIVDLIVELNRKVGAVYGIRVDAESLIKTVMHTINRGICLVGPHACAGGFLHPYVWNHDVIIGTIQFWNFNRPSGIKIFPAIAEAFRQHGATHIHACSHYPANLIGRFYERYGLHAAESGFISSLSGMKTIANKTIK